MNLEAPVLEESLLVSAAFREALKFAADHADDVDRGSRFPSEAVNALKVAGALGCYVPSELGGMSASFQDLCDITFELSRRCSASGMVFAMHQIQVASIVHHLNGQRWFEDYLRRIAREQRLIASATSEVGVGGEMRRSIAAVAPIEGSEQVQFEKQASTISYGGHSDDLLTSVRRHPSAEGNDQVLVLTHKDQMEMKQTGAWDTLGMRGTCSPGFVVRATCSAEQVMGVPFATIAAETVVPFSHILWAHVWLGTATDAFERAQNFVRAQARQNPGTTPPSALRLSELSSHMAQFRALVRGATEEYVNLCAHDRPQLSTIGYAVRMNNLKIAASEAAAEATQGALRVTGIMGYKNGTPYSVGRHLRDSLSAALMIANDRIHSTNAALLLVYRDTK
jgi:acyl-CoA dehydrogenase